MLNFQSLLVLNATEPVTEPVTQMAVEVIWEFHIEMNLKNE